MVGLHVEALACAVARAGGRADVLVHGERAGPLRGQPGVRVTHFPQPFAGLTHPISPQLIEQLRTRSAGTDLLHVHGRRMLAVLHAAHPAAPGLVFTPHYYASPPSELRRLVQGRDHRRDREFLAQADLVICVSHSEALNVERSAPGARTLVIPNGVDAQAIASARPLPVDGRLVLTVDRLTRLTGIHRIISALPALPPTYRLAVVGRGRWRNTLEAHSEYLRVADRVRFLGWVDDPELHRWLRSASVVVTLKEESLWGGMLLVAACAGTPVVASDVPANREAALLAGREGIRFVSRRA